MDHIFLTILILLLIMAVKFEKDDMTRVSKRPPVYLIKDRKKREREYLFYGTFNSENNIMWRSIYISTFISVFCIIYMLKHTFPDTKFNIIHAIIIFAIIFFVFYGSNIYRTFHFYRLMSSKLKKSMMIL